MHIHIICICVAFPQCEFLKLSSCWVHEWMQNHNDYICFEYHNGCFFFKMSFRYDIYSHWLHLGGFSPKVRFKSVLKLVAWVDAKLQWLHLFGEHLVNPQLSLLVHHHLNGIHHPHSNLSYHHQHHRHQLRHFTLLLVYLHDLNVVFTETGYSNVLDLNDAFVSYLVLLVVGQLQVSLLDKQCLSATIPPNSLTSSTIPWETSTAFSSRTWSILWSGECPKIWGGNLTVHGLKCKFSHSSGLSSFHPIAIHNLGKLVQFCLKFNCRLYPV